MWKSRAQAQPGLGAGTAVTLPELPSRSACLTAWLQPDPVHVLPPPRCPSAPSLRLLICKMGASHPRGTLLGLLNGIMCAKHSICAQPRVLTARRDGAFWGPQGPPGPCRSPPARICLAVPAWSSSGGGSGSQPPPGLLGRPSSRLPAAPSPAVGAPGRSSPLHLN